MGTPVAFYFRIFIFIEQQVSHDEYSYADTMIGSIFIDIDYQLLFLFLFLFFHDSMMMMINTMYVPSIHLDIIIHCITIIIDDNDDTRYE